LDRALAVAGIPGETVAGYEREEWGHLAVAAAIASGTADVGIGVKAAAVAMGLDFLPLEEERYDLVIPEHFLSDGPVQVLLDLLKGTPHADRLVSSEPVIRALRGRKSKTELENIQKAVDTTEEIIEKLRLFVRPGLAEKEIAAFITGEMGKRNLEPAWDPEHCPAVFTGPESAGAHSGPTGRKTEPGHLMNIDFGVKVNGYCSDMQRSWYFLKPGETKAPSKVQSAFDTLVQAIQRAAKAMRPGAVSWEMDDTARSHIKNAGFGDFPHALGHEIGLKAHDGSILCPKWDRYGNVPFQKLEENQVYTIEPRIILDGYGVVTMEEIVVVTGDGAKFMSHPQTELWLVSP
jgi:Xaa-Pro aminopeptidase